MFRLALTCSMLVAVAAHSQPAPAAANWSASPEAYFMTIEEQAAWKRVKTDAEAEAFIAAFRARRGKGFAAEVERRVAIVDERLALGDRKASKTLRGKLVILLGGPAELHIKPIAKSVGGNMGHPLETRKGGSTDGPPKTSIIASGAGLVEYTFRYVSRPELGIGPEGWTIVIEADAASGKDRLKSGGKRRMEDIVESVARQMVQ